MNNFNNGMHVPQPSQNQQGPDKKLRLLLVLLLILGGTLVFLSTPAAEKMFGFRITSLFSGADWVKVEDPALLPTDEPPITATDVTVNCLAAPCPHPDLSILNPEPKTVWQTGSKVDITWDGFKGSKASIQLQSPSCVNASFACSEETIVIVDSVVDRGTYSWSVPQSINTAFLGGLNRLVLTIDDTWTAQTTVEISATGTGTANPTGSYIYFPRNPMAVYRIEGSVKRPLPYPAHEVIACLGDDPVSVSVGTQAQDAMPIGSPLFCNPPATAANPVGSLLSGVPGHPLSSVFYVERGNTLRPFPTSDVFHCLGYDFANVHIANTIDIQSSIGPAMTCDDTGGTMILTGTGVLPNGVVNVPYSAQIGVSGGTQPYSYKITGINPTANISINNQGQLSGTFTSVGTYSISIFVEDSMFRTASRVYTLQVTSTPTGGGGTTPTAQNCVENSSQELTALYRFYSSRDNDHYYATTPNIPAGFVGEGITAYIYKSQVAGTVPLYQSYNVELKDHYYSTDLAGAQTFGYRLDGIVGYVYPNQVSGSSVMYRMYNHSARHYMMTTSTVERDAVLQIGFVQQGVVGYFCGVPRPGSEIIPIYRLWSSAITDHFYTTDIFERDTALQRGYISEGIAGHVYSVPGANRTAVYRLWSSRWTNHFYTTSDEEARNSGYAREGIMGYIATAPSQQVTQLYRLYSPNIADHFYTTSTAERDAAVSSGYRFEGTMGYLP
ncbi:MAG TPA: hypothetical protein PKD79_00130 [Candidatus Doudnabacteria bacterium]|nr:hypothetical protein [Candidatus Doudnabacteria bacterium]